MVKIPKPPSALEAEMALHIRAAKLPEPAREQTFAPGRRWRFDFSWPEHKLALEVEGGIWNGGRHTRPAGFQADAEKYNAAAALGWRVYRVTAKHIKSGEALAWITAALQPTGAPP